jgi:YebC/PmpR family DNA-binding regulatory protein
MSGHSKWATTHRQKEANDAKRGAIFTRLANVVTIAAREKGGDINMNFSLRIAVERAKAANMPKENIERAIKRGTGELGGALIEELVYEGIGPANTQFVIKILTDNKNRTAAEIRHIFAERGGSMSAVLWNFDLKGVIRVETKNAKEIEGDEAQLELIDAGAEDIKKEEGGITIFATSANLQKVKDYLEGKKITMEAAGMEYVAKDTIEVSGEDEQRIEALMNSLDENQDVADYYTNLK